MKKFLIGVFCGLLLAGMACFILFFAALKLGDRTPSVPDSGILVLKLQGEIAERAATELPYPFGGGEHRATVPEVWSSLRKAAADKRIRAVLLQPQHMAAGWAKLEELRADLLEFRKSGKPVIAFLVNPSGRDYYLAAAADKVYLSPQDMLDLKGLRAEMMFFRKTLDKLGVQMEVQHVGKFKDAGDVYTRTEASPETTLVLNSMLDGIYGQMVGGIAEGRKRTAEEVRAIIDQGPFTARQAKAAGLVDDLLFEEQAFEEVKRRAGKDAERVSLAQYARVPASSAGVSAKRTVALVVGEGAIIRGSDSNMMDDANLTAKGFIKTLRQVRDNASIKAVILRINSPGGDAVASDDILHEVKLLAKKKPTVISMSDYAASGGYYIASTGDRIVAYPNTLTGSIGVVYSKPNLKGLYDKIGITKQLFTRGRFATLDSDYQPMSEAERRKLRESMDEVYSAFLTHVAASRHRKTEEIEPLAQGRVWLGSQAKQNGLVDEVGGLNRAMELAKLKAGIPSAEPVKIMVYPAKQSLFDKLVSKSMEASIDPRVDALWKKLNLPLWSEAGMKQVMPFQLEIE